MSLHTTSPKLWSQTTGQFQSSSEFASQLQPDMAKWARGIHNTISIIFYKILKDYVSNK
jgi:hypothetical protein